MRKFSHKLYTPALEGRVFSDEEMAIDWTLSDADKSFINHFRKSSRLFIAIQMCIVRLYGRFLDNTSNLSPRIINYMNCQLNLPPSLGITVSERKATYTEQYRRILKYLGFRKFTNDAKSMLEESLKEEAIQGALPDELVEKAEGFLLSRQIMIPGPTVLKRLAIAVSAIVHQATFIEVSGKISPELKQEIEKLLMVSKGDHQSYFNRLKEYPPSATVSALKSYIEHYERLESIGINELDFEQIEPSFQRYLYNVTRKYSAKHLNKFNVQKRYTMMVCFLIETKKVILDYLIKMHEQFIMKISRECRNIHEKNHKNLRNRQKRAVDKVLILADLFLTWPEGKSMDITDIWDGIGKDKLQESVKDLRAFKSLEERGYGNLLIARYPTLRKYFSDFIRLPFEEGPGNKVLTEALKIVRELDSGVIKSMPLTAPTSFIPKELKRVLKDIDGKIKRNAWEMGLALAMRDALRSGDLFIPQSKEHVSFWDLMLSESRWAKSRDAFFQELQHPVATDIRTALTCKFNQATEKAGERFSCDNYAEIHNGKLKLKRYEKIDISSSVAILQKAINASMPKIRIEQLLMEVDLQTGYSKHFVPIQGYKSRPKNFYKTLMATIVSQTTNLGVVAMSASVEDVSIDQLRHVLRYFLREETLKAANTEIVNQHHQLPLTTVYGAGDISSSDGQRFKIRADSLLGSYYPRYYGYYEKAIGLYTHVSDQYSVFSTKIISCSSREAMYVLDGLLENNTILKIRSHTTDTHGYTEIIFALCHLLGFYFMPRIKDLKNQQLYRVEKTADYGPFTPLLNKTVNMDIIEEQWESMMRVVASLRNHTAPAHIIVQRLTNCYLLRAEY